MARTKKQVSQETLTAEKSRIDDYFSRIEKNTQPVITSITINPNGTIFGLADNKVYRYDEVTKQWGLA